MRVPQRLDYALRALTTLALLPQGTSVAAGDVADRLGLPRRFVEQQLTVLSKHGIVSSQRGPGGGASLGRPAHDVSVRDVIVALQGDVIDVPRVSGSAVSEMWVQAARDLSESLGGTTLADLASRQRELDGAGVFVYHI